VVEKLAVALKTKLLNVIVNSYVFRVEQKLYADEGIDIGSGACTRVAVVWRQLFNLCSLRDVNVLGPDSMGSFADNIKSNENCIALFETPLQGKKLGSYPCAHGGMVFLHVIFALCRRSFLALGG